MKHDFSVLCATQLEKLEKRLKALQKSAIRDYKIALTVINDRMTNDHAPEIFVEIDDILNDVANKTVIFYTEALNKAQRSLSKHLLPY